jgi:glycosyltransferase involved in cell wall biosynthesis
MSPPRITVAIPVYNHAAFIGRAIESVLAQTCADWRLLIIDDASTDGTVEVVRSYRDLRLELHCETVNAKQGGNWNRCVARSSTEYVHLLCADDELFPSALTALAAALDRYPDAALAAGQRTVATQSGRVLRAAHGLGSLAGWVAGGAALRATVRAGTNLLGEPSAVMIRRASLHTAEPFRAAAGYCLDWDLWVRVLECHPMVALRQPVAKFRVHRGSDSVSLFARRQFQDTKRLLCDLQARLPGNGLRPGDIQAGLRRARFEMYRRRAVYALVNWLHSFGQHDTARAATAASEKKGH